MSVQIGTVDGLVNITTENINCFVKAIRVFSDSGIEKSREAGIPFGSAFQRLMEPVWNKQVREFDIRSIMTPALTRSDKEQTPARMTYCRKMGLLDIDDADNKFTLTQLGGLILSGDLSVRGYAFLLLSKQGIFVDDVYAENLFAVIGEWFASNSVISEEKLKTFVLQRYPQSHEIKKTRADIILNAFAFCGILSPVAGGQYAIADTVSASILELFFSNRNKISESLLDNENTYTEYIGGLKYGISDILNADSRGVIGMKYPDLVDLYRKYGLSTRECGNPDNGAQLQLIFYGAPGTGKSFAIDQVTDESNSVRTTFHPDSDYAGFVGAYKPTMAPVPINAFVGTTVHHARNADNEKAYEKKIVYKYVPQAFLKAYVEAWKRYSAGEDNPYYLVIEEINRGNCAQIFGDLFQLLDRNNMGCSSYTISADEDIAQFLREDEKGFGRLTEEQRNTIGDFKLRKDSGVEEKIGPEILNGSKLLLPPNLRIWATMNTSDQSLFPIDSAFKRRWNWEYMPIEYDPADKNTGERLAWKLEVRGNMYYWGQFLEFINPKILKLTLSEDKQMGYFFARPDVRDSDGRPDIISEKVFVNKVLFYLWTDVFKDYDLTEDPFVYENEDKSKRPFRFTDFFPVENNAMLDRFIKGMKLTVVSEENESNNSDTEEVTKRIYGRSLVIKFPDGTVIKGDSQFDSYMHALEKIGLDKAMEVVEKKGYSRNQAPLISKEKYDVIENSSTFSYVQNGDYYIIKGIDTMEGTLKGISKELGLNLEVYFE